MSEDTSVEHLIGQLFDSMRQFREIYRNQQETLVALSQLVNSHTQGLRMHQKTLESIAGQMGIAFDAPEPSSGAPN